MEQDLTIHLLYVGREADTEETPAEQQLVKARQQIRPHHQRVVQGLSRRRYVRPVEYHSQLGGGAALLQDSVMR